MADVDDEAVKGLVLYTEDDRIHYGDSKKTLQKLAKQTMNR